MLSKQDELKVLPSLIIPQNINMFAQSAFQLKFHISFLAVTSMHFRTLIDQVQKKMKCICYWMFVIQYT